MYRFAPLFILFGCATIGPEDIAWKLQTDNENWHLCELAYSQAGAWTFHSDHRHSKSGQVSGMSTGWALRSDLADNHCRSVLGDYWIEY